MTPTQISNLALDAVPSANIVAMTENSLAAKTCSKHFAQVLGEIMEMGPWRFAVKRQKLAELPANDRESQWLYAFVMPSDMAFPLQVLDASGSFPAGYEFTGVFIYTNTPTPVVEYVTTSDVASASSALFRAALIALLAARICLPITKDLKRTQFLSNAAEVATTRAQAANHNQQNQGFDYFDRHTPTLLRERLGLALDQRALPAPDASYPDPDYIALFNSELAT